MTTPVRTYDLTFNRQWTPPPLPPEPGAPPPRRPAEPVLVPIIWDGLNLQFWEPHPGDARQWFTAIVENVDGWYAGPPVEGNDAARALGDGSIWGPKIRSAREIIIEGAAVGPRARLIRWRDELAFRAAQRYPSELIIGDPWLGTSLTAMVRAGSGRLDHDFFAGNFAFRYKVTVTAADPRLYERDWRQVVLSTRTAADSGRPYDRFYYHPRTADPVPDPLNGWTYEDPYPPGSAAYLANSGNADAPVYATYDGDLHASQMSDGRRSIWMAALDPGVRILVGTETLVAEAPGGAPRAQWVQAGSRPMVIPGFTTARWHLYSQGSGTVTLNWRSAWW